MAWLARSCRRERTAAAVFAALPQDVVEERLCARRDLLTRLDLVFMDPQPLLEGAGGQTLGQPATAGHRPDLRQMILAVLLDGDGRPVARRCGRGPADVTTLIPVIDRLACAPRRVCAWSPTVADQRRDRGGAGGAATVVHPGRSRTLGQAGA